jgi:hypothetical protein
MIKKVGMGVLLVVVMGFKHMGPAYDTRARNALDLFAKEFAKKHSLIFLNSGVCSLADAKEAIWVISLTSSQKVTLEEGRALAADLTYQLLYQVFHNPLYAHYCQKAAYLRRSADVKETFVGFRLAFWDQNTDRPLYPYLAQIRLADGNLYYHYADPETQALQEPLVESIGSLNLPGYR